MVNEDLHAWLGVRVVGRFEFQFGDADFVEEVSNKALQVGESEILPNDEPFYLMEFGQVSRVECFVSENPVNGEEFGWSENSGFLVVISDLLLVP